MTICNYYVANNYFGAGQTASLIVVGGVTSCKYTPQGGSYSLSQVAGTCPANSTGTSSCTCNSGYVEDGTHTSCVPAPVVCTVGTTLSSGYYDSGTSIAGGPPAAVCNNGCLSTFDGTFPTGSSMVDGVKHYYAKGSYNGVGFNCNSGNGVGQAGGAGNAPAPVGAVPPDSCSAGKVMGQVNGQNVCVTPGDGTSTPPKADPPTSTDSTGTTSSSTTVANPDGSTTTTTTTVATGVDGSKTTTVTTATTSADGKTTTTGSTTTGAVPTKDAGKNTACQDNPASSGCGGDPSPVDGAGLYTAKDKTVASVLTNAKNTLTASGLGSAVGGFFNVSGGGGCPSTAWNIPYLNKTVTVDTWCSSFAVNAYSVIRGVLLMVAGFMAFRIAIE